MKKSIKNPEALFLTIRKEFPILRNKSYLVSHSMGAMPRESYKRLKEYSDKWCTKGIVAWDEWAPYYESCCDTIRKILNAPEGTISMHQNVSVLVAMVASCFEYNGRRNKVVDTELNFPSVHYVWEEFKRTGVHLVSVKSPDGITVPTEEFINAIDEDTQVVMIEQVIFRSGFLQDVKAITDAAHKKGAIVVVDAYQAVGTVPVDVQDLGVDVLVGGSHKWLMGGPGAAYIYVRKDLIGKLTPKIIGWFSHKQPFSFVFGRCDFRDDAMKFTGGTPSMAAYYAARAGHEIIAGLDGREIRKKNLRQTDMIVEFARENGFKINTPTEHSRRGGMICIDFPDSARICDELVARNVQVDHRPQCGIRMSPHFYTTDAELEEAFRVIRKLTGKKSMAKAG